MSSLYENVEGYGILSVLGPIALFFAFVFFLVFIGMYIIGSLGLMKLAKANKMENPWFAFIPVANAYLIGKLGYQVYTDTKTRSNEMPYIMLGLSAAAIIIPYIKVLAAIALVILTTLCYNKIYKNLVPNNATLYTILSFFFGGIPLFFKSDIIKPYTEDAVIVSDSVNETNQNDTNVASSTTDIKEEKKEETKEKVNKEVKEETKTIKNSVKFCSSCGAKLNEGAKFCPSCGNKIN